jgi:hypothetical protein
MGQSKEQRLAKAYEQGARVVGGANSPESRTNPQVQVRQEIRDSRAQLGNQDRPLVPGVDAQYVRQPTPEVPRQPVTTPLSREAQSDNITSDAFERNGEIWERMTLSANDVRLIRYG